MTIEAFGRAADGAEVSAITLAAGDLSARILTFGAILQAVHLTGTAHSLTLGSGDIADYGADGPMRYFGPVVGPVVNRIAGATAIIDGQSFQFEADPTTGNTVHSGPSGTWNRVWAIAEHGDAHVVLTLDLPDGTGGFPGNRSITARFEVAAPATLRLILTAVTDAPTPMNLANHSYWSLDGGATWEGHHLCIAADAMLPTTDAGLPTGEVRPVAGTPYDFRNGQVPGIGMPPLDHNFCLSQTRTDLRDVLWLRGRNLTLTMATTEPGLQVYDGRAARRPGKGPHEGLAFEAQFWPDAPHHVGFPSITLAPGETWRHITEWRFAPG